MKSRNSFINRATPALVLAPMDGITDFVMRRFLTTFQPWSYCVSEFIRVSQEAPPAKVFRREVPELLNSCRTESGVPVQVQILGGDPDRMARAAEIAIEAGASGIDINFGCPAPTVNRHDGGATLLKYPDRIEQVVSAVRQAVPRTLPVSAKLRLGWDDPSAIYENAVRAEKGGASWITIHGRTKFQGYTPPAYWEPIGAVRRALGIPVVANGEIWTVDDLRRCQDQTGSIHFMVGRGALARPWVLTEMWRAIEGERLTSHLCDEGDWAGLLSQFRAVATAMGETDRTIAARMKHWLKLAEKHAGFDHFDRIKRAETAADIVEGIKEPLKLAA